MVLLDMLGRRWTLRVLWELREAPLTFRKLRAHCDDVSPTSLNARLKDLQAMNIIALSEKGYGLTGQGQALMRELAGLNVWAKDWADKLA